VDLPEEEGHTNLGESMVQQMQRSTMLDAEINLIEEDV